jgi:signal transduction histidine kinase/CHASE3 domain sensor protein
MFELTDQAFTPYNRSWLSTAGCATGSGMAPGPGSGRGLATGEHGSGHSGHDRRGQAALAGRQWQHRARDDPRESEHPARRDKGGPDRGSDGLAWLGEHGGAAERRGPCAGGAPRGRADRPDAARERPAHADPGGAFAVLLVAVDDLRKSARAARDSQEVLAAAHELEGLVVDLETGLRGFVLTRENRFLEPWHAARGSLPARAAALERLSAGNPGQERMARQITQTTSSYIEEYADPLLEAAQRGDPAAREVATTAEGKRRVDAIRADFDSFIGTERRLADARQAGSDDAARRAVLAAAGCLAVLLLLVLALAGYLARAIVQPVLQAARMAVELAGGNLSTRMPANGVAEIGQLEWAFNEMAGSLERNRDDLAALAAEQAALRRVATLVAEAAAPEAVFAAVAVEVGRLFAAEGTGVVRYDRDGAVTSVGSWNRLGRPSGAGWRATLGGQNVTTLVFETGRPARIDRYATDDASDATAIAHRAGVRSAVGAPMRVEGRLWGALQLAGSREAEFPAGTEERLAGFAELAATAIANAQAREELRRVAEEQAALRHVATLVARGAPPAAVFAAVAEEVGRVLPGADFALVGRYDQDRAVEVVGGWSRAGDVPLVGLRTPLGGHNVNTLVFEHNRPARVDHLAEDASAGTAVARQTGARSSAGAPISVEGRLWGVMIVASAHEDALPPGIEHQLAEFTELLATAIANSQAREELRTFADEQAALRRVATLVAQAGPPSEVFEAVTREVGLLCDADLARMERYEDDGTVTGVAAWSRLPVELAVGTRFGLDGVSIARGVQETAGPVRVDSFSEDTGVIAQEARALGIRASVGCPIMVAGRLWGVIAASTKREEPFPPNTEARISRFTELVATAVENAESRAELAASRARVVAAADETRRRLERDLHDGAQQRLVSLALRLQSAAAAIPPELAEVHQDLAGVGGELNETLTDLRELSRGIHPAILSEGGLGPALRTLARRSPVPVQLQVGTEGRLPERVEVTAYYVVAEALTNVAKHANASAVEVDVETDDGLVRLAVRDDGVGGADPAHGSGLIGLKDRVEGTGGTLRVESRPGQGTSLLAELPIDAGQSPDAS